MTMADSHAFKESSAQWLDYNTNNKKKSGVVAKVF